MISSKDWYAWRTKYHKCPNKTQRLGQAFLNEFMPQITDPELFYKENQFEAEQLIQERYVQF